MLFTLEALPARFGDALLLHYGDPKDPKLIVIDGGTATVYEKALRPRLAALHEAHKNRMQNDNPLALPGDANPLPIEVVMVSHLDDDHIRGILDWTDELARLQALHQELPCRIATFWHNSFDDVVGNVELSKALVDEVGDGVTQASAGNEVQFIPELSDFSGGALVLASVDQGHKLRANITTLGFGLNGGAGGPLLVAPETGRLEVILSDGLKLTVLGPLQSELSKLQKKWDEELPKILAKRDRERQAAVAEFADKSVFNLSSIVVLAELEVGGVTRRMLLTGDARGDFVLRGLEAAGLLDAEGRIHVDLLKLPHHGSIRNVDRSFFDRVRADHYVVSSDGDRFNNPDLETLDLLSETRGEQPYTLYLTYPKLHRTGSADLSDGFAKDFAFDETLALFEHDQAAGLPYQVRFREPGTKSIRVDLGSEALQF